MRKLIVLVTFFVFMFGLLGTVLADGENATSDENESALSYSGENNSNLLVLSSGKNYNKNITVTNVTKNPNAASLYCEKKGYSSETREDTTGKEYNVCVFPDGKECNELEFLREKCGREYVNVKEGELVKSVVAGTNLKLREGKCGEGCSFKMGSSNVMINELSGGKMGIAAEDVSAATGLNLTVEEIDGKIMLRAYLSNGRWALVKYLPDKASDKAAETLGEKCAERNCTLELKEVKVGGKEKLAYEVKTSRDAKTLMFIKSKLPLTAQVDAESGQVISVKKPWWAFLAR